MPDLYTLIQTSLPMRGPRSRGCTSTGWGVDNDPVLLHEYSLAMWAGIDRHAGSKDPMVVSSAVFKHLEIVMDLHYVPV